MLKFDEALHMQSSNELILRQLIMSNLADLTADLGTVTREQLTNFTVGDQVWRLIDQSRGIRNPASLEATLTVMSSRSGPYDDSDIDGSLFKYDYRAGSDGGDNTKLRRAYELGYPIILLLKLQPNIFVPYFRLMSFTTIEPLSTSC